MYNAVCVGEMYVIEFFSKPEALSLCKRMKNDDKLQTFSDRVEFKRHWRKRKTDEEYDLIFW